MDLDREADRTKRARTLDKFHHHDQLCKKFRLSFLTGGEGGGQASFWHPPFIHQFYPDCEHALDALQAVQSVALTVSTRSFRILVAVYDQRGEPVAADRTQTLLAPLLAKFPSDALFLDHDAFQQAEQQQDPTLCGRGTPLAPAPQWLVTVVRDGGVRERSLSDCVR